MRWIVRLIIALVILIVGAYAGLHYYVKHNIDDLPDYEFFIDPRANVSIKVLDQEGQLIGVRGAYYGGRVYADEVSENLINAIIAVEDRNFYTHGGYDVWGIIRAMIVNLKSGGVVQGASTLTQQLAKDLFFSSERSYSRKLKELLYAVKLEQNYTKEQILTLYLNRVYLGAGLYGVAAAAERYFGKSVKDLTVAESAMIAGLLKAPSRYSPTNSFVKAEQRAAVVIHAMYVAGYITNQEKEYALENPAKLVVYSSTGGGGYIADYTADIVSNLLPGYTEDLIVTVSIDMDLQNIADTLSEFFVDNEGEKYGFSQVAFVALNDKGQILAMTGGKSYAKSPYNRAVTALRQPGSAFKAFVYAAAFDYGYNPNSRVIDGPVNFNGYAPGNYTNKYKGEMSIRNAFSQSINTVAVKLAHQVGIGKVINTAYRAGIKQKMPRYLSIALGATEVSLLELTNAYMPFYNGGHAIEANIISEIQTKSGEILYKRPEIIDLAVDFSARTCNFMKDVTASTVAYGTGRRANIKDVPVYGKTGTTSNYKDAWFLGHAGLNNGITAGVWVGNDNTQSTKKATGGGVAAVLWHNILENYIYNYKPELIQKNIPVIVEPKLADDQQVQDIINQLHDRQETVTENKPIPIEEPKKNIKNELKTVAPKQEKEDTKQPQYDEDKIEQMLKALGG